MQLIKPRQLDFYVAADLTSLPKNSEIIGTRRRKVEGRPTIVEVIYVKDRPPYIKVSDRAFNAFLNPSLDIILTRLGYVRVGHATFGGFEVWALGWARKFWARLVGYGG